MKDFSLRVLIMNTIVMLRTQSPKHDTYMLAKAKQVYENIHKFLRRAALKHGVIEVPVTELNQKIVPKPRQNKNLTVAMARQRLRIRFADTILMGSFYLQQSRMEF